MNNLIKLLSLDDGEKIPLEKQKWCLDNPISHMGRNVLCGNVFIGYGESSCTFEEKECIKGGITCEDCLQIIKDFKKVKL